MQGSEQLEATHAAMVFFHGTSEGTWVKIQKTGALWSRRFWEGRERLCATYLTPYVDLACHYGSVVLVVEHELVGLEHSYPDGLAWQFTVSAPIALEKLRRLEPFEIKEFEKTRSYVD